MAICEDSSVGPKIVEPKFCLCFHFHDGGRYLDRDSDSNNILKNT